MQTHKSTYTLTSHIKLKSISMDLIWLKVLRNSCTVPYLFISVFCKPFLLPCSLFLFLVTIPVSLCMCVKVNTSSDIYSGLMRPLCRWSRNTSEPSSSDSADSGQEEQR